MNRFVIRTIVAIVMSVGCHAIGNGITSQPLNERSAAVAETLFERVPSEHTGIDFAHVWNPPEQYKRFIHEAVAGSGVCIGDYDNDGRPDLFLTSPQGGNRLYRNLGDFRFENASAAAGIYAGTELWGTGATFADVDNDGDLDLYLSAFQSPNMLYINGGDGTFTEEAAAFGLNFVGVSITMAFADYDRDGDLDAYLLTNSMDTYDQMPEFKILDKGGGKFDVPEHIKEELDFFIRADGMVHVHRAGQFDHLYRNDAGAFVDVTEQAGITGNHFGLSTVWWDYDQDGWPDLYVSNDFYGPDQLFRNNGDGTFTDEIATATRHTPWFSMGADSADINNDGWPDLMAADMAGTTHYRAKVAMGDMNDNSWFLVTPEPRQYMRNAVYLNAGVGQFMDIAFLTGLSATDWTWSVKFGDLDNDGLIDLFTSNGMTEDQIHGDLASKGARLRERNLAFRNRGGLQFENVAAAWGLDDKDVSFGAAYGDLDGDGDLDLVVNNFDGPPGIYRNQGCNGHRMTIRLVGTSSNRWGVGATVRVATPAGEQMRYLTLASGYMSANEPLLHFGLGGHDIIDRLRIEWPSGVQQEFTVLAADQAYTITEPEQITSEGHLENPEPQTPNPKPSTLFEAWRDMPLVQRRERPYDDFKREPLLPNKLSQLGPGIAIGDLDGNCTDDMWLSAAVGNVGALIAQTHPDRNDATVHQAYGDDVQYEDMAPLLFDADGDGDLDLYVVSGGVECDPGDPLLRDRLYLNNGVGVFSKAPADALPDNRDSGSCVVAADFDRDGDLDLFVGGRVVPGQYTVSPNSRLLRNTDGKFEDVTDAAAPGLRASGMVTSALWSDANGDGWIDLLVTYDWAAVRLWRNNEGRMTDHTAAAGLNNYLGWWNGIAGGDFDNDGDIDYVVSNFGLNTKYHASHEHPLHLYYGDFDGSGIKRLIEAEYEDDTLYPVRGKSCSTHAIPELAERLPTFHSFAIASLADIYTPQCLNDAVRSSVDTLESGVLLNDGSGRFEFRPLPRLAQISPGFGIAVTDVNADGNADIYLAQNFFQAQAETGRMDSGLSQLLLGDGSGSFHALWPHESGLIVNGDATAAVTADLNGDGWPDFVVGVNDGPVHAFVNRGNAEARPVRVQLQGCAGNPAAIGAKVTVRLDNGSMQTAEVYAGSSYLGQSTSTLSFGLPRGAALHRIDVRWPDGSTSQHRPDLPRDTGMPLTLGRD
jgi:hypothetical protein